jgi:hypothetical protein
MIRQLKNTPVRDLIRALEHDGFEYRRRKVNGSSLRLTLAQLTFPLLHSVSYANKAPPSIQ